MSEGACPTATELDRAFGSAAPDLVAHVASCPACTAVWTETAEAIALVRELPAELPPAPHCEEQRTALLAAFEHHPTAARRHNWLVPAVTAAAASVLVALWPRAVDTPAPLPAPAPASAHVVHPHAGAHYTIAAEPPDEIVRLREGTIDVDVRPLRPGERFRVIVGADQLEVHGTSFEVVAAGDHLVSVHVVHGRVEVRRVGSAPAFVGGGQSWHAIAAVAGPPAPTHVSSPRVEHAAPPPARAAERMPAPAESPPPAPTTATDPQETAFVAGWDAMRRGELAVAADAFARAVALDPHGDLAEDGTFWHAVAVARLHRTEEAIVALRGFIGTYPASTRAGEASVMLGWILVDRNQLDEARLRFQAAIHDPSESVQTSARAGLAALERARR